MAHNMIPCTLGYLLSQVMEKQYLWVDYSSAANANEVWVRRRLIAVITVIIVTKPEFQNFSHLLHCAGLGATPAAGHFTAGGMPVRCAG